MTIKWLRSLMKKLEKRCRKRLRKIREEEESYLGENNHDNKIHFIYTEVKFSLKGSNHETRTGNS